MIADHYLEIPRIFTALAEAIACLIYILPLKKRSTGLKHKITLVIGPLALLFVQMTSGELPLIFWVPGMMTAMAVMFLYLWRICDITAFDSGFLFVRAFILAEFAAALGWQIYYYILYIGIPHQWLLSVMTMLTVYGFIFGIAFWIDAKKIFKDRRLSVSFRELLNVLMIGLATFLINNINFVMDNPFTASSVRANLLYIRTLVDFCGLLLLYASNEQRKEMYLNHELNAINDILHRHYDQYQASKENIELINRKYHDFKHQIAQIRSESDPVKKDAYLEEISHSIKIYESRYETGNTVVDTILTGKSLQCYDHDISLSCVVNGSLLNFMYVMDICSVFGNAIDNSIESVLKIPDKEKRIIRVAVFSKNGFLMMRFENYFEETLVFLDGLPVTTKSDSLYHGYGIKSIQKTIETYNGNLTISSENNWFVMKILIPIPRFHEKPDNQKSDNQNPDNQNSEYPEVYPD